MRCASPAYDRKLKKTRQCRNPIFIGSFCKAHTKTENPQGDPETEVETNSSLSQLVMAEDDIANSMQKLTLSNVESLSDLQDWMPNRVCTVDSFSSFGVLDPDLKRWTDYMPRNLSGSVYQDVLQYFSRKPSSDRWGQVYIVRSTPTWRGLENGEIVIKIGRADNAEEREKSLKNWCKHYTFKDFVVLPDTKPAKKIRLSRKAEVLSHKTLANRLFLSTSSGKCICQKKHEELFKIPESELKSVIKMVRYWVNVVDNYEELWPGISLKEARQSDCFYS